MLTSLLDLALLRLDALEAEKLRWFFCHAEGELGLQSGMGLQLERARVAGGRNRGSKPLGSARAKDLSDDQLEAAFELAQVSRRLARLTAHDAQVLRVHYGPLLPVHRQHEPTHTGGGDEPGHGEGYHPGANPHDQPLRLFDQQLALVLYLTAARGVDVETVIETARRALHSKGQRKESAQAKTALWLAEAERALVQASAAYAATRHLVQCRGWG